MNSAMKTDISAVTALLLAPLAMLHAEDYSVSPIGSDQNPGTREKPLATLIGARDLLRQSGKLGKEAITVHVLPSTYYLNETLVFTDKVSGTTEAPAASVSLVTPKRCATRSLKDSQSYYDQRLKLEELDRSYAKELWRISPSMRCISSPPERIDSQFQPFF